MPTPTQTTRPAAAPAPAPAPRPAPTAATSTRVAQGGPPAVRLPKPEGTGAPGVLDFKGMAEFAPPSTMVEFLDTNQTSTVNARFGTLAEGPITVHREAKGRYAVRRQRLALAHPLFTRIAESAPGLAPTLVVNVEGKKITGHVGLAAGAQVQSLADRVAAAPDVIGLAGFKIDSLPRVTNAIESGSLHVGLKGVPIRLGGAFSGTFDLDSVDGPVNFSGNATVNVKGLANGTLALTRSTDGLVTGKASVGLTLPKNLSGNVDVTWDGRAITGMGKVGYQGEKFSGEVTLQLMEAQQARQLAESKKGPEGAAPPPAAAPAKKPSKVDYVVFGEGDLGFAFTDWLNGTAHVIVDHKGDVTVIGKITPQKEFILFEQKDYVKQLFKLEARASYGIPVAGNIFIFGNVSMDVFAKLGPAKFYNIVAAGTYSTDPTIAKDFSILGKLNISAGAGTRLRAEAGAGLEILAHDIKAGAGINGIAGIKAYAEATPVVGYRENAPQGQDKKGEWFIRGELEVAAQPFLGLSGDLFVEVDAPWWSPCPDKKWTWPLISKEWPLGGNLGILVAVDYVFGSGQWPKFDFKPIEFDSSKFMSDMYEDKAKSGPGKELEQKGKWAEKNSLAAQVPPKASPKGNAAPGKPATLAAAKAKPVSSKKSGKPADPNAKTKEGKTVKQLQDEATKKGKKPDAKDLPKGKEESKKGMRADPEAVKANALADIRAKSVGKMIRSIAGYRPILQETYALYRSQGLKSLVATADPESLEITIRAAASEPEKTTIRWAEVFTATPADPAELNALLEQFRTGGPKGDKTFAAISVNGRLIDSASNARFHAEIELLGDPQQPRERWLNAIRIAEQEAKAGGRSNFTLLVNNSPCGSCSPALARWLRPNRKKYPAIDFILAASSNYQQSVSIKQLRRHVEDYLTAVDRPISVPLDKLLRRDLEQILGPLARDFGIVEETATTMANLRQLQSAGWNLYHLDTGGPSRPAAQFFARRIALVKKAADKLKEVGKTGNP